MLKKIFNTIKQHADTLFIALTTLVLIKLWYIGWAFKWVIVNITTCTITTVFLICTYHIYKNLKNIYTTIYLCILEFFAFLPHISAFSAILPDKHYAQSLITVFQISTVFLTIIMLPIMAHTVSKHQVSLINIIKTAKKKHTPSQEEYKTYLPWCLFLFILLTALFPIFERIQNSTTLTMPPQDASELFTRLILLGSLIVYYAGALGCLAALLSLGYIKITGLTFQTTEAPAEIKAKTAAAPVTTPTAELSTPLQSNETNSCEPKEKASRLMRIVHYFVMIFITGLFLLLAFTIIVANNSGGGNIGETVESRF